MIALIRQGVYGDKRALALGDVGTEVLVGGLLGTDQVEQIILDLEGKAGVQAKGAQCLDLLFAASANDGPGGKRRGSAVIRGLVRCHVQVIVDRDVKAPVTDPTQVERLTLDGADDHLGERVEYAQLYVCLKRGVVENRLGDHGKCQVAAVDSKPRALGEVHAGLATAQLAVIGDVIMDKRTRLEMLDGRRGAAGALKATAHCGCGEHADKRTVALAGVGRKSRERRVQVALDIGRGCLSVKERGQIVVNLVKVLG